VLFDHLESTRDKARFRSTPDSRRYGRRLAQIFRGQCASFTAIQKPLLYQSLLLCEMKLIWKAIDTNITLDPCCR
jgi:hypothetical protein